MSSAPAKPFDHLIFDLDDTLLDTSNLLIPRASREACAAMISSGLNADIEACVRAWGEHGALQSRRDLFSHLVERFGVNRETDAERVAQLGYQAFYNRRVESDISLFSGAHELLSVLGRNYGLHLVTSGTRSTQEEKIRILKIEPLFDSITHVDPTRGERKRDAFAAIQRKTDRPAERHLSIGNRIDTDVSEARELGWKACWVRYGEYVAMTPTTEIEQPDYIIENITELARKCQL